MSEIQDSGAQAPFRVNVGIPLFRSWEWRHVVASNIRRLSSVAHLTISDPFESDATFSWLKETFFDNPEITWLGTRKLDEGWREHCNDLQGQNQHEFFMWLEHDDLLDSRWIVAGQHQLESQPEAIIAVGNLRSLEGFFSEDHPSDLPTPPLPESKLVIHLMDDFTSKSSVVRARSALDFCFTHDTSALGLLFRGIQRAERTLPIPHVTPDDAWADIVWALRILTRGPAASTDETYWKNWHASNTHSKWPDMRQVPSFRIDSIPEALLDLSPTERESVYSSAWADEALGMSSHLTLIRAERDVLLQERNELREEVQKNTEILAGIRGCAKRSLEAQLRRRR